MDTRDRRRKEEPPPALYNIPTPRQVGAANNILILERERVLFCATLEPTPSSALAISFMKLLLSTSVQISLSVRGMWWLNGSAPGCKTCSPEFESGISPTCRDMSFLVGEPAGLA